MSHHYSGPDPRFPHGNAGLDSTGLYAFAKPGRTGTCILMMMLAIFQLPAHAQRKEPPMKHPTLYRTIEVDGLSIFYREAGPKDAPTLLLLHGLPSSSRMFEPLLSR